MRCLGLNCLLDLQYNTLTVKSYCFIQVVKTLLFELSTVILLLKIKNSYLFLIIQVFFYFYKHTGTKIIVCCEFIFQNPIKQVDMLSCTQFAFRAHPFLMMAVYSISSITDCVRTLFQNNLSCLSGMEQM